MNKSKMRGKKKELKIMSNSKTMTNFMNLIQTNDFRISMGE